MAGPTPAAIGWLQRALRHEFGAARQFTLQSAVAKRLGDAALAAACEQAAQEELVHAQRFAMLLAEAGSSFGDGAAASFPIGRTRCELLAWARETEAQAVRLYREAARACAALPPVRKLFEDIGAEEAQHLASLQQWSARQGCRDGEQR